MYRFTQLIVERVAFRPHLDKLASSCKERLAASKNIVSPPMLLLPFNDKNNTFRFVELNDVTKIYDLKMLVLLPRFSPDRTYECRKAISSYINFSIPNYLRMRFVWKLVLSDNPHDVSSTVYFILSIGSKVKSVFISAVGISSFN